MVLDRLWASSGNQIGDPSPENRPMPFGAVRVFKDAFQAAWSQDARRKLTIEVGELAGRFQDRLPKRNTSRFLSICGQRRRKFLAVGIKTYWDYSTTPRASSSTCTL